MREPLTPTQEQAVFDEHLAGATYVEIARHHQTNTTKVYEIVQRLTPAECNSAAISRAARESAMQDRICRIVAVVASSFDMPPGAIWGCGRRQVLVRARFAAFLVCHEAGVPGNSIARAFEMDHTSVIHGRRQALNMAGRLPDYAERIAVARRAISRLEEPRGNSCRNHGGSFPKRDVAGEPSEQRRAA